MLIGGRGAARPRPLRPRTRLASRTTSPTECCPVGGLRTALGPDVRRDGRDHRPLAPFRGPGRRLRRPRRLQRRGAGRQRPPGLPAERPGERRQHGAHGPGPEPTQRAADRRGRDRAAAAVLGHRFQDDPVLVPGRRAHRPGHPRRTRPDARTRRRLPRGPGRPDGAGGRRRRAAGRHPLDVPVRPQVPHHARSADERLRRVLRREPAGHARPVDPAMVGRLPLRPVHPVGGGEREPLRRRIRQLRTPRSPGHRRRAPGVPALRRLDGSRAAPDRRRHGHDDAEHHPVEHVAADRHALARPGARHPGACRGSTAGLGAAVTRECFHASCSYTSCHRTRDLATTGSPGAAVDRRGHGGERRGHLGPRLPGGGRRDRPRGPRARRGTVLARRRRHGRHRPRPRSRSRTRGRRARRHAPLGPHGPARGRPPRHPALHG
jgi:hypothetical protein